MTAPTRKPLIPVVLDDVYDADLATLWPTIRNYRARIPAQPPKESR